MFGSMRLPALDTLQHMRTVKPAVLKDHLATNSFGVLASSLPAEDNLLHC